jgi:molecular chaperone HtpG
MQQETLSFRTEVSRLLDIVAHALYTHKEIFLRELISNASDACDRLRYLSQTEPELTRDDPEFTIRLIVDRAARTLAIADNGIGMSRDDLIENIGTIARSGTEAFLSQLTGDAKKDMALIGQFGVGFYSAFMVADRVEVISRKAGGEHAWRWSSDGKGQFTIEEASREGRGTTVILHLKAGEDEFLEETTLRRIVKKYSDHIGFPIRLGDGDKALTLNAASSLWTRPKKDITEEQYTEFYHHTAHLFDDPWLVIHNVVEGVVSYTNLLFVPGTAPFDLFHPDRKSHVKLYVKKVFITDNCEGLLPAYLRFLRGVIDSEDLPLNISRETFQHDPRLAKIRQSLVKRILDELEKKANDADGDYETFWTAFGAVLKEGLYEDFEHRQTILRLARFRSTAADGLISLDSYVERMKPGQEAIYWISGEQVETLARSPQLEGFRKKGVEVLLLTDPIDEFWIPSVRTYQDKPFKSATSVDTDLSKIEGETAKEGEPGPQPAEAASAADLEKLLAALRKALDGEVKDVRSSQRLTDSAVCLVAAEGDRDMYLERLLRQHRQIDPDHVSKRILEINPAHPLIKRLADLAAGTTTQAEGAGERGGETGSETGSDNGLAANLADAAWLLLDQARIVEGEPLPDPVAFSRRLATIMERGLGRP